MSLFETVCRDETRLMLDPAVCVRFSEQNHGSHLMRLFATDQFCKSLAVISCLD
jgi:hypothetical protein